MAKAAAPPVARVISIGTLSSNPLWQDPADARTGHATTTLIEAPDAVILVDPGLPPVALDARLSERTPRRLRDVTHVFLTSFDVEHVRGLSLLEHATWLVHEPERVGIRDDLEKDARDGDETAGRLLDLLDRCRDAEDRLAPGVDLFPLPGTSPGSCGLLLPLPSRTVLVAGDAVATVEHLRQAQVLPTVVDLQQAKESFAEAIEIADEIVCGRDNVVVNPARAGY